MSPKERQARLRTVLSGSLEAWEGLPRESGPEDFEAVSGSSSGPMHGRLGGIATELRDYAGHPGPLRVFFDHDAHAYLAWLDWVFDLDADGLVRELDEPEAKLSDVASRRPGTVQWVWGARGLTAYVADDGTVRGLALFQPAALDYYLEYLGASEGVPYRPRRGPG